MPTLEFDSLPLIQVDLRVAVDLPGAFPAAAIVLLHEALKERFPKIGYPAAPEYSPGRGIELDVDPMSVATLAFTSDSGLVAILQSDLVMVRWLGFEGAQDYPRFKVMRETLDWIFEHVQSAIGGQFNPTAVQVSYWNFVSEHLLETNGVAGFDIKRIGNI